MQSCHYFRKSHSNPKHHPSADLQTIMNGNWQRLDPTSLFKLLNNLATSKETLPDDYYAGDYNYDEDAIDLMYSGNKPLPGIVSSPLKTRGSLFRHEKDYEDGKYVFQSPFSNSPKSCNSFVIQLSLHLLS